MPATLHEAAALVGYGQNGYDDGLDFETTPRMQRADVDIVGVGPDAVEDVTNVPPRTIVLDGVSGCTGDSGGPLLAASGAVLGVYSLLAGETCLDPLAEHYLTHVPAFPGLTEQAFAAAGYEPVPEPDEAPSESASAPPAAISILCFSII